MESLPGGCVEITVVFEVIPQPFGVHVIRPLFHVDKVRLSPGLRDGFGCRDKGVRDCDDYIALLDTGSN